MKRLALAVLLCCIASPCLAVEDPSFDYKKYCKDVGDAVGGSSQIELACRDDELKAKERIAAVEASAKATGYCKEVSEAIGGSYVIFEECLNEESAAEKKLAK